MPPITQKLCPTVISLIKEALWAYNAGFTHPRDPLPSARRAAFMLEKKPPITGADADVPDAMNLDPPTSQAYCTAEREG